MYLDGIFVYIEPQKMHSFIFYEGRAFVIVSTTRVNKFKVSLRYWTSWILQRAVKTHGRCVWPIFKYHSIPNTSSQPPRHSLQLSLSWMKLFPVHSVQSNSLQNGSLVIINNRFFKKHSMSITDTLLTTSGHRHIRCFLFWALCSVHRLLSLESFDNAQIYCKINMCATQV